ncbi:phytase [Shewanella sp. Isolate11]|uniref:phytase n=1 Tax=Shewanella sp. Isolate11 TaxID=2908530 RepID=UPI001EFD9651|nr:phytase [Shewanella sp. Isolate11]MCG9695643.1 phytase [Shewanella sp. Isolate11]
MNKHLILTAGVWLSLISGLPSVWASSPALEAKVMLSPKAGSEMTLWQQQPLFVSETQGLILADKDQLKVMMPGQFEYLSVYQDVALTYDTQVDQVQGIHLNLGKTYRLPLLPKRDFQVEWLCLQARQVDQNLYAWIGDDAGHAEQWLLSSKQQWQPQLVRRLSVAMGAQKCAVDVEENLLIIDQHQGLWAYPAAPHMPAESELLASMPDNNLSGLVVRDGQVYLLDESGTVYDDQGRALGQPFVGVGGMESLYMSADATFAYSDDEDQFYRIAWSPMAQTGAMKSAEIIKEIPTAVESDIADRAGDTMDDPAIWVHPTQPEKSRVIGTNKRWGLLSFSMQGEQLQGIPVGRVNNVDIRQQVLLGGKLRDIAVASNRDRDSLSLFEIDANGVLTQLPEQSTGLTEIYGLCLFQPNEDTLFALVNDKSGVIHQIALEWQGIGLQAREVRQFKVPSQPEGCVVDDATGRLFTGEEDQGIWLFDLTDKQHSQGEMIIEAGGPLVADIEGVALYQPAKGDDYLVVSSQGNDSYILYQAEAPYDYVARFRIGVNGTKGFDGSAETDGLDVTALSVGTGKWAQGMMVVQDGRNRLPEQNQNFKWIPWSDIQVILELPK